MISLFFSHVRSHLLRYAVALVVLFGLTAFCIKVQENYPFSHFPMYGNPRADDVDYYFLTDAAGKPLSTGDYAGMSAPQIKKRINKQMDAERIRLKVKKLKDLPPGTLESVAKNVLQKMRDDAANPQVKPPLMSWPAGVQLKLGLIETEPDGFRENFRTVARLEDAGPDTGGAQQSHPDTDVMQNFLGYMMNFLTYYGWVLLGLGLVVGIWKWLPERWRAWLSAGNGFCSVGRLEAFFLRLGLAYIYYQAIQTWVVYDSLPHPQGLAHWESFREAVLWCGHPEQWSSFLKWTVPLLVWYVVGWGNVIPLTILTLMHILQRTLYGSQGAPHHGHQLLSLVFLAQTVMGWVLLFPRFRQQGAEWCKRGNETLVWLGMAVVIGAAYVITAVEKWDESDGKWLQNAHYFSNQIVKTHRQNYYNDLNPVFLEGVPPKAQEKADPENDRYRHPIPVQAHWMLTHPILSRIFFSLGFLMEATAFLLIFNRGWAALYGVAILAFHLMVLWLMKLAFPQNIEIIFVLLLNLPGWVIWWRLRKESGALPAAESGALPAA